MARNGMSINTFLKQDLDDYLKATGSLEVEQLVYIDEI